MVSVWVNQQAQHNINVADRGLAYGDGLFATMRTHHGKVLLLDKHLNRLVQSALRLGINWQPSVAFIEHLQSVATAFPQHCLKLIITRGQGGRGYGAPQTVSETEILSAHPLPEHYPQWHQQGITLKQSDIYLAKQPALAGMKHLNRLEQVLIKSQPLDAAFQDWLVLDSDGLVIESSVANIFAVKGNEITTPALTQCGVSGVTREAVIEFLLAQGMNVTVAPLTLTTFLSADHVFLTNSLFHIVDVTAIDETEFASWPNSQQLRTKLLNDEILTH